MWSNDESTNDKEKASDAFIKGHALEWNVSCHFHKEAVAPTSSSLPLLLIITIMYLFWGHTRWLLFVLCWQSLIGFLFNLEKERLEKDFKTMVISCHYIFYLCIRSNKNKSFEIFPQFCWIKNKSKLHQFRPFPEFYKFLLWYKIMPISTDLLLYIKCL